MALIDQTQEIERLIRVFESESDRYHDIEFHTYFIDQTGSSGIERKFRSENHAIMLCQYIGTLGTKDALNNHLDNLKSSDLKWGVRGAQLTHYGVIEGAATKQFIRMAKRAGSIFSEEESYYFKTRMVNEIFEKELRKNPKSKPAMGANSNPLAIWLNYLLFYLSRTHPNRDLVERIEPDLFTLSLLALEQLSKELVINKSDKSSTDLVQIDFQIAVSFPGEKRRYVSKVVDILRDELGTDKIFLRPRLSSPNCSSKCRCIAAKHLLQAVKIINTLLVSRYYDELKSLSIKFKDDEKEYFKWAESQEAIAKREPNNIDDIKEETERRFNEKNFKHVVMQHPPLTSWD